MADNDMEYRYLLDDNSRSMEIEINKLAIEGYEVVAHAISALSNRAEDHIWHTVVMRRQLPVLSVGTATAEQEAAERADLDERLAVMERKGTLNDGLQHMNESLILEMASRIGKTEARLALLGGVDIAVLEDRIGDLDERLAALEMARDNLAADYRQMDERVAVVERHEVELAESLGHLTASVERINALNHSRATTIAVLEDSIGGVSKRQGETYSDVCGLAERIKRLEDDNKELHKQLGQCLGKAEQADGKANVAVDALFGDVDASIKRMEERQSDIMESLHLQRQRIKRLEDELVAIRQNQEWRPAEDEGEPVGGFVTTCDKCGGTGQVPIEEKAEG